MKPWRCSSALTIPAGIPAQPSALPAALPRGSAAETGRLRESVPREQLLGHSSAGV